MPAGLAQVETGMDKVVICGVGVDLDCTHTDRGKIVVIGAGY